MIKTIIKYFLHGVFFGVGITISLFLSVSLYEEYRKSERHEGIYEDLDKYITEIARSLPEESVDYCDSVPGTWVGSHELVQAGSRSEWEAIYSANGDLKVTITEKTGSTKLTEIQIGTWRCSKSILFTKFSVDGVQSHYNYLLLYANENERVYAQIGIFKIEEIFTSYKKLM